MTPPTAQACIKCGGANIRRIRELFGAPSWRWFCDDCREIWAPQEEQAATWPPLTETTHDPAPAIDPGLLEKVILRALDDYAGNENWAKLTRWMEEARDVSALIKLHGLAALLAARAPQPEPDAWTRLVVSDPCGCERRYCPTHAPARGEEP